jgi:hypothetical protein
MLSVLLTGCMFAVYTPVVVGSALGLDRETLNEDPRYAPLIGRDLALEQVEQDRWLLRKFDGGRYFVEVRVPPTAATASTSTIVTICDFTDATMRIDEVFLDRLNGGVHFSAQVTCPSGERYTAPINHWYSVIDQFRSTS